MLKINPIREYTFKFEVEEGEFAHFTFDFPEALDIDYSEMRKELVTLAKKETAEAFIRLDQATKDVLAGKEVEDRPVTLAEQEAQRATLNLLYKKIRSALKGWKAVQDNKGKELTYNTANRNAVFSYIKEQPELWKNIILAYRGETDEVNLTIGLQQCLNTAGVQSTADGAS